MQLTDDKIVFSILIISVCIFVLIVFFMIVIVNNFRKNLRRQQDTLKLIFATEEKERKRIAQDLHDNLGAMLSSLKYYITTLSQSKNEEQMLSLRDSALEHVDKALLDLRETVQNLIPKKISENGWLGELDEMLHIIQKNSSISTQLEIEGEIPRYPLEAELNLYRIVQEMINNSLKYAEASQLSFLIHRDQNKLSIYYNDNGKGFDVTSIKGGYGLRNLQARASLYGGFFDVKSDVGNGCYFKFIFEEKYFKSIPIEN